MQEPHPAASTAARVAGRHHRARARIHSQAVPQATAKVAHAPRQVLTATTTAKARAAATTASAHRGLHLRTATPAAATATPVAATATPVAATTPRRHPRLHRRQHRRNARTVPRLTRRGTRVAQTGHTAATDLAISGTTLKTLQWTVHLIVLAPRPRLRTATPAADTMIHDAATATVPAAATTPRRHHPRLPRRRHPRRRHHRRQRPPRPLQRRAAPAVRCSWVPPSSASAAGVRAVGDASRFMS